MRYDPILVEDKHSLDWHIKQFEQMAATLSGYTKTCVISFIDIYKKVERNFPEAREVFQKDRLTIGKAFIEIAKRHDITIRLCAVGKIFAQEKTTQESEKAIYVAEGKIFAREKTTQESEKAIYVAVGKIFAQEKTTQESEKAIYVAVGKIFAQEKTTQESEKAIYVAVGKIFAQEKTTQESKKAIYVAGGKISREKRQHRRAKRRSM